MKDVSDSPKMNPLVLDRKKLLKKAFLVRMQRRNSIRQCHLEQSIHKDLFDF
jgi:hypothetical protein